ncbi:MAG: hypothetical protein V4592_26825 [Bacteroidota bacterium]
MNRYHKITLALLAFAICLNVSCTKNTDAIKKTDNTAAISKQLALGLYQSLSSGVSTISNGGVKTGSTSRLITMDTHSCGQSVTSVTDRTETKGDTTRTYLGNAIFTYMCNGFLNNGTDLDAYLQKDVLTTTETGTGFKNIYNTTLDYDVRALDATYQHLKVNGATSTNWYNSNVSGNTTTSSYTIATNYTWTGVIADTSGPRNAFLSGDVAYTTQITDKTAAAGADGKIYNYHGTLTFMPDFKMKVTFNFADGTTTAYLVNILTGETTAI